MKKFTSSWNYDLNNMPEINEQIRLLFSNGIGTDQKYPYLVESIEKHKRGDFNVYSVEGRQIKKDGSLKDATFLIIFTDRPKDHHGWVKYRIRRSPNGK